MNKIKYIFTLIFVMTALFAKAASGTIELEADDVLMPGGDAVEVTVSLTSEKIYVGFGLDIVLPEGLTPVYDEEEETYCLKTSTVLKTAHTLGSKVIKIDGKDALRVSCMSATNTTFKKTSGSLFTFKLQASAYAKTGIADIKVQGIKFGIDKDNYDAFSPVDITSITIGTDASTDISVSSANKWSTCVLPFPTAIPDGVKAYSCASKNDEDKVFNLTEVSTIEAYKPYILYSEAGYTGTLTGTINPDLYPANGKVTEGLLSGAITKQTVTEGYILQKNDGVVKFYKTKPDTQYTIPAGRCWISLTPTLESYSFHIVDITGIKGLTGDKSSNSRYITTDGKEVVAPMSNQLYKKINK